MQVDLNIGSLDSDPCSQGIDVNFTFRGFGITGRVVTSSSNEKKKTLLPGPKGVSVSLYNEQDKKTPVGTTVTAEGGTFSFTPIQPGKYVLVATHPV